MGSPVETTLPTPEVDPGRLRAVRIATVACLLVTAPLFIPPLMYALVLWWLWRRKVKKGLALAVGMGSTGFAVELAWLALMPYMGVGLLFWCISLGAVLQAILVLVAVRAYYTMRREPGDRRLLVLSGFCPAVVAVSPVVLLLLVTEVLPHLWGPPGQAIGSMSSAVDALNAINVTAKEYARVYKNGFPANLATLGPPPKGNAPSCNHADLIDPWPATENWLAMGKRSGYVFQYTPGPPVPNPPAGCVPGVQSYTLTARPEEYYKTGWHSFFTDQSGVIRWTREDRPATTQDSPGDPRIPLGR
ncbi:MAG TPA: hypothetical protein VJA25_01055 [Dehalococcoidia bacterium]|nr:hypothetical protein [Dehalococcoidia bacterium]